MVAGRRDWNSRRALSQASTPSHWRARAPHSWRAHEDAVESRERTAYSPDIRAWPCFVAHLTVRLSIGNANFGWAASRGSCGPDQVRAEKEAKLPTGPGKWFNRTKANGFIHRRTGAKTESALSSPS